jgi:hypothetical protein
MNKQRIALILSLLALAVAGCGGDDDDDAATTIPTVPLSVPGGQTTSDETTDTTADTVPDTGVPAPAPTPAPAPAPPVTPDSPENDTPPPADSEAEEFENFCAENPGFCED